MSTEMASVLTWRFCPSASATSKRRDGWEAPSGIGQGFDALLQFLALFGHRLQQGSAPTKQLVRGGLAAWQQRIVTTYIEEHLAEPILLATLAELAGLSTYYSAGPSSSRSACRRTATTRAGASSTPRHCWPNPPCRSPISA